MAAFLNRLGSFARVVAFDKRGAGVSDPVPLGSLPRLEEWMDDVRTVMDAAGMDQAALLGDAEWPHGDDVRRLAPRPVRRSPSSTPSRAGGDDYPIGMPDGTWKSSSTATSRTGASRARSSDHSRSVANDPAFTRWYVRYQRAGMPRGAATEMYRWVTNIDVRSILPTIRVPTLVVQRAGARHHRPQFGRYLAEHIPGATSSCPEPTPSPSNRRLRAAAGRGRGVPDRGPLAARAQSAARHSPLHRHRRLDEARGRARGRRVGTLVREHDEVVRAPPNVPRA